MNQHANPAATAPSGISPAEWQARIDLAAVYRLCAHYYRPTHGRPKPACRLRRKRG